jgi:hypothetical protein
MKLEEKYGIPVAPISTYGFINIAQDEPRCASLPFIYTPHPVIGLSPEALDRYIAGKDPDTGKIVIDEIIDVLTRPVKEKKAKPAPAGTAKANSSPALLKPDTEDNLQRLFYERGWTDGLPIILPTVERVQQMLTGTSASPDEIVIDSFPFDTRTIGNYNVGNIAAIAVMAGARPEHLPVILATAATKQRAIMPSTTPFGSVLLVNGPIRKEIGMNSGIGAFSPVNIANSVIGRAWTLMSHCWGFTRLKKTLWTSQGNVNYCIAENEEASGWEPFHVGKGFKADESVVSVFMGWTFLNSTGAASKRSIGEELNLQMGVFPVVNSAATLLLDPLVANNLKENENFSTKKDFCRWLSENIKMPAGRYWGFDYVDMMVASEAYKGIEPYASWKKLPDDALIAPYYNPDNINIVVVGGETSPLWKATDYGYQGSASVDRWRALPADGECADGSCGLPDEVTDADYD